MTQKEYFDYLMRTREEREDWNRVNDIARSAKRIKNANYELYKYNDTVYKIEMLDFDMYLGDVNMKDIAPPHIVSIMKELVQYEGENVGGCIKGIYYGCEIEKDTLGRSRRRNGLPFFF